MNDFPIPKDAYVAFDGLSIKQKIKDRLNTTGIFTDQNYEGSNLAGFNDAIAMSFSLLLYYLNQNSVNGQFSETTVYENINKIVKELDYKPVGHQTPSVEFNLTAKSINSGFYTIPRYSSISIGGLLYSLSQDISFTKVSNTVLEEITGIENDAVLYQGAYTEMPIFSPVGTANELIYLTVDDTAKVDNFNLDVYVKTDGMWEKWTKTQSLYINNSTDKVYELRFSENRRYELKFGDGINGRLLSTDNEISIYYLVSAGERGEIGVGALQNKKITPILSTNLSTILQSNGISYMTATQMINLSFYNKFPSTYYAEPESVESIRKHAPGVFRSQFSITTKKSYSTFLRSNFSNILHDVKVMNNTEYLDSYIKYFYDLGLTQPQNESRALFNQINFSDSCNFNNVYIFSVPKRINQVISYLTPAQKDLIVNTIRDEQVLTSETILADPVYIAFDLCVQSSNTISKQDIIDTELVVVRNTSSRRNERVIKTDIETVIVNFFKGVNNTLGQIVNLQQLNTDILNIEGVSQIFTRNKITDTSIEGIKMINWNPVYFDITVDESASVVRLQNFQFPFLQNKTFVDRIVIR